MNHEFVPIGEMERDQLIEQIWTAVGELSTNQYKIATVNRCIQFCSLNCKMITTEEDLLKTDTVNLRNILTELHRILRMTMQIRMEYIVKRHLKV